LCCGTENSTITKSNTWELAMGKHKLEVVSSSGAKKMKFKTKDTNVEI
jgi:hypothetical protein